MKYNPWFLVGFIDASKKALVIWGINLTSTVGIKFTRNQKKPYKDRYVFKKVEG